MRKTTEPPSRIKDWYLADTTSFTVCNSVLVWCCNDSFVDYPTQVFSSLMSAFISTQRNKSFSRVSYRGVDTVAVAGLAEGEFRLVLSTAFLSFNRWVIFFWNFSLMRLNSIISRGFSDIQNLSNSLSRQQYTWWKCSNCGRPLTAL